MLRLEMTNKFKRDYKLCKKRGLDISLGTHSDLF